MKSLSLLFLLYACLGVSTTEYVPLKDYTQCALLVGEVTVANACQQLERIKKCIEDLITASGARPDESKPFCHDEESYPYCSMLTNSRGAPMVGSTDHPTICRSYVKIIACLDNECGPSGKKFDNPYYRRMDGSSSSSESGDSCPVRATKDCVGPVKSVTEVTEDSCIEVAKAKNCFIDKLNDCSGTEEEQRAADINLAGLVQHVEQCTEENYSFSKSGDLCVPNPMDVFIPKQIKDNLSMNPFLDNSNREKALKEFFKANCPIVESVGTKLEEYMTNCNVTSHNQYTVSKVIEQFNGPRLQCMKAGYNLPQEFMQCDCPRCFGIKCYASGLIVLSVAVISIIGRIFNL